MRIRTFSKSGFDNMGVSPKPGSRAKPVLLKLRIVLPAQRFLGDKMNLVHMLHGVPIVFQRHYLLLVV